MAFVTIPNNDQYEYDNAPPDPGVGHPMRALWLKSSNGVRTEHGHSNYVRCRRIGSGDVDHGELSKSYWDARGTEDDIETDMILVFRTTAANEEVRVGAATHYGNSWPSEQDYDGSINWGDGTTTTVTGSAVNNAGLVHTFASAGDHTVRVSGPGFHKVNFSPGSTASYFGGNTEAQTDKLLRVLNLGDIGHKSLRFAFYRTRQMLSFTLGHTDLSNCNNMGDFFKNRTWQMGNNAVPATVDLTGLDTSGFSTALNQISKMFKLSAVNMNTLNLTELNTANITNMNGLFYNISDSSSIVANALNLTTIDVSLLNTSSVTSFTSMFYSNPTVTTITGIEDMDTSSVEWFNEMFSGTGLTGSLDLSSWDWSSGKNYSWMFNNVGSLTDIIGIENINVTALSSTSALSNFLNGVTLPTSRYDQLLINLAAQTKNQASQTAHFGSSQYTAGGAAEAARTSLINNDGYTITDGGAA